MPSKSTANFNIAAKPMFKDFLEEDLSRGDNVIFTGEKDGTIRFGKILNIYWVNPRNPDRYAKVRVLWQVLQAQSWDSKNQKIVIHDLPKAIGYCGFVQGSQYILKTDLLGMTNPNQESLDDLYQEYITNPANKRELK